ncbi:MAG: MarR family transcriptional regulator [Bacteroidota bacterium]|nr:MarR family transcriptional regulator [Bacteroidota bacterium]
MRLEDEIKQQSFRSEYHKLVVNMFFTGSWLNFRSFEMLKPFKLTPQQFNILRILKGQFPNPATVNLLIERMLDKMSNASRIVDRLVAKKLVERKTCIKDRRCVDVRITEKGITLLEKIAENESKFEKQFSNLSIAEAKKINTLLDKLRG